jgi:hypothetical protein
MSVILLLTIDLTTNQDQVSPGCQREDFKNNRENKNTGFHSIFLSYNQNLLLVQCADVFFFFFP